MSPMQMNSQRMLPEQTLSQERQTNKSSMVNVAQSYPKPQMKIETSFY
jgi:hypothetical protein